MTPSGAPKISFALVVYREQAYIRECISSILSQSYPDLEIVAVDDASPDHGPDILDELAAGDDRLKVVHLDERLGVGEARNRALELVNGDYVWFVETTDYLPQGALATVAERLDAAQPDVAVVDHTVITWTGSDKPSPCAEALAELDADATALHSIERPPLAELADVVWNKVVRRSYLTDLGVRFGQGGESELSLTYPVMLASDRLSALSRPCYLRRVPLNAVREAHVHGSPFDSFAQYDEVFAFAQDRGKAVARRRRFLLASMLRHYKSLLGQVPEDERRRFFHEMAASYRRHAAGQDARVPGRLLQLQSRLVARDWYHAFGALDAVAERRHAVLKRTQAWSARRQRRADKAARRAMLRYYEAQMREPVDENLAVFAAYWFRGYSCNPRAIYEKMRELVPGVRGVWVVEKDAVDTLPEGVPYVVAETREYYQTMARAKYLVNNVNFPNEIIKRPGSVHVQTHHGTPLKKMGLDLRTSPFSSTRLNFRKLVRRCERWDFSVSANVFSTEIWERVYPTDYESLEVGYPRNDALVNATDEDVRRARERVGVRPGQTAVLYAPTHREYHQGYVPVLDLARLADELGTDYVIMARTHYFYDVDAHLADLHRSGRILDVAGHASVEELCLAADVLVTDYSSIMFDYAVLDRPIVIHAPDWEVYRAMRGTYFDLMAEPPGTVARSENELVDAFCSGSAWGEQAESERAAFRRRFCSLEDGHAAERVVRRVWLQGAGTGPDAPPVVGTRPDAQARA